MKYHTKNLYKTNTQLITDAYSKMINKSHLSNKHLISESFNMGPVSFYYDSFPTYNDKEPTKGELISDFYKVLGIVDSKQDGTYFIFNEENVGKHCGMFTSCVDSLQAAFDELDNDHLIDIDVKKYCIVIHRRGNGYEKYCIYKLNEKGIENYESCLEEYGDLKLAEDDVIYSMVSDKFIDPIAPTNILSICDDYLS